MRIQFGNRRSEAMAVCPIDVLTSADALCSFCGHDRPLNCYVTSQMPGRSSDCLMAEVTVCVYGWIVGWVGELMYEWMMGECIDGWMNELIPYMDGLMNG